MGTLTQADTARAGFTGHLITAYLAAHPEKARFTFGICARSKDKLHALRKELQLDDSVKDFYADVTKREEVDAVVRQSKVIINAVGPFWEWGTPVVRCVAIPSKLRVLMTPPCTERARRTANTTLTSQGNPTGCAR